MRDRLTAIPRAYLLLAATLFAVASCSDDPPDDQVLLATEVAQAEVAGGSLAYTLDLGAELAFESAEESLKLGLGRELAEVEQRRAQQIMREVLADTLTEERFEEAIAGVYARHLTEAELNDLLTFYESPTGQRILSLQVVMEEEIADATEAVIDANLDEFAAEIDRRLAEAFPGIDNEQEDD